MAQKELNFTQLAELLGMTVGGVSRMVKRSGLPFREVDRGNYIEKLVDLEALESLRPETQGRLSLKVISDMLGVSTTALSHRAIRAGVILYRSPLNNNLWYVDEKDLPPLSRDGRQREPDRDGQRFCSTCRQDKPVEAFYPSQPARCKACHNVMVQNWAKENPEKKRAMDLKAGRKYEQAKRLKAERAVS